MFDGSSLLSWYGRLLATSRRAAGQMLWHALYMPDTGCGIVLQEPCELTLAHCEGVEYGGHILATSRLLLEDPDLSLGCEFRLATRNDNLPIRWTPPEPGNIQEGVSVLLSVLDEHRGGRGKTFIFGVL